MTHLPLFAKTVGRRKSAVANLKLIPGLGEISINGYLIEEFFVSHLTRLQKTQKPFCIFIYQTFDVNVRIQGGGLQRKSEAFQVALTRALVRICPDTKYLFREHSFLTCDSRKKERRKYGLKKARKAQQFSKRLYTFHLIILQQYLFMSQITKEIIEKLKILSLIEAVELASQIENTFGVDIRIFSDGGIPIPRINEINSDVRVNSEKTTFDVILEFVDRDKRVAVLKIVRTLTNLGLKEAKDFCSSLPKAVKERISKEEAEIVKKELEKAGSTVTIK